MPKLLNYKESLKIVKKTKKPILGIDVFEIKGNGYVNTDIADFSNLFNLYKETDWLKVTKQEAVKFFEKNISERGLKRKMFEIILM